MGKWHSGITKKDFDLCVREAIMRERTKHIKEAVGKLKIVQIMTRQYRGEHHGPYQDELLGLGSDGVVYRVGRNNKWEQNFPNSF